MNFDTKLVNGAEALNLLNQYRARFRATNQFPFLIGDDRELERLREAAEFNKGNPAKIIEASSAIKTAEWIAERRQEAEEYEFSPDEVLGEWPGEVREKGSIGLHKDVLTGKIKPKVYLGMATISMPWYLPAIVKYGAWNDCPEPEVHCAFHRAWQANYGAEITGMSGDVIECIVANPPSNRNDAIALAWEQYWYCADIVDQGCGSVANLAATLVNSPYWYFWWD
jgi:hypothetical protein